MKVWVIVEGCIYDGSSLVSVHSTESGALGEALEMIQAAAPLRKYREVGAGDFVYDETDPSDGDSCWRDGSLFIQVECWEVLNP